MLTRSAHAGVVNHICHAAKAKVSPAVLRQGLGAPAGPLRAELHTLTRRTGNSCRPGKLWVPPVRGHTVERAWFRDGWGFCARSASSGAVSEARAAALSAMASDGPSSASGAGGAGGGPLLIPGTEFFSGGELDRLGDGQRTTPHLLEEALASDESLLLPFVDGEPLVVLPPEGQRKGATPAWVELRPFLARMRACIAPEPPARAKAGEAGAAPTRNVEEGLTLLHDYALLGKDSSGRFKLVAELAPLFKESGDGRLSQVDSETAAADLIAVDGCAGRDVEVMGLRGLLAHLGRPEHRAVAQEVGHGRSLLVWHSQAHFCGRCGSETEPMEGGTKRRCKDTADFPGGCGRCSYPRTDPIVIVLVTKPDGTCLLGRTRGFPPGMYSCLAGFLEPGESVEEAVRREVKEETGINVGAVKYVTSQPWPLARGAFAQLMIGCHAEGTGDIKLNESELEAARWFTRDEITAALGRKMGSVGDDDGEEAVFVPPAFAIAHTLVRHWLPHSSAL